MADSKLATPRADTASPPPHCAICLGTCKNKCRANSCMHEFCYNCLLEWSRIKAECPLCKQEFKSILHNIKSLNEYDVHIVENIQVENNRYLENASLIYLPPATPPMHQYHFRTTFTVDTNGEHAIQQMLLSHPLLTIGGFTPDRYTTHRRRRGDTSTSFRRSVYTDNLWVYAPPDITGRYRDVSPSYYRNNPAARTRLVPWLNRELNALLFENTQQVMHLVDIIMDHLLRHHICSYMFRSLLYEYLGNKTDHFIHEFYNFMRSPFDMVGYDRHVIYTERQQSSPIRFIDEIDVSDYDSDVILVSDTNNNQGSQGSNDPVIIDLVETDSDEPIIVSEERSEPRCIEEEENRKPILPLKLRIKNRHKSKEKRSKAKKRHRQVSSSSLSSTSMEASCDSDCEYKRYHQKRFLKKLRREKKKRKESYYVERVNSSDDEDVPLSTYANRKKRAKHSKHKSHTITSDKKDKKHPHRREERTEEEKANSDLQQSVKSEEKYTDNSNSDDSFYSEYKRCVKSKIKDVREEKPKAGPSSGRLRNTLKKEANTNLWYSRPLPPYDSDSSDS